MSLKTRFLSIAAVAMATAVFSSFVPAQETTPAQEGVQKQERRERGAFGKRGDHNKGQRGARHGAMSGLRGIDLTDAQKEQLRAIHQSNRPDDAVRQEIKTIAQAKRDGTITPEQQERLKALKLQAREKGQAIHQQVLAILTPEQRQQIEVRKEEMRKKIQERRELRQQNKTTTDKPKDN